MKTNSWSRSRSGYDLDTIGKGPADAMMLQYAIFLWAVCFILPQGAAAACLLSLSSPSSSASLIYDPFEAAPEKTPLSLFVKNAGDKACDGSIAFFTDGKAEARGSGSAALQYQIGSVDGRNLINIGAGENLPLASASLLRGNGVQPKEMRTILFSVGISSGQVVVPNTYAATMTAVLYQDHPTGPARAGTIQQQISVRVSAVMSANIAGGGQQTTLDFGLLTPGATRSVSIQARSNQGFRFTAASENGGVMKLEPPSLDGLAWRVPYTIRINNGAETSLNAERVFPISREQTNVGGSNVPFEVKVGDIGGQRAGRYRDVIVVKIGASP